MVETELAKVYAGSERTLAGVAKSVHFHDWLMDIEFNASRNSYQLSSWFKSLICVLQVIQRVWMSWETDSSHWMTNCHESCKMSFAITMIGPRRPEDRTSNLRKYDLFWYNMGFCIKFAEKLKRIQSWHWFHCMSRIHESAALSLIMTGTWSRLFISNSSGQFEAYLLNSNAPNFNS